MRGARRRHRRAGGGGPRSPADLRRRRRHPRRAADGRRAGRQRRRARGERAHRPARARLHLRIDGRAARRDAQPRQRLLHDGRDPGAARLPLRGRGRPLPAALVRLWPLPGLPQPRGARLAPLRGARRRPAAPRGHPRAGGRHGPPRRAAALPRALAPDGARAPAAPAAARADEHRRAAPSPDRRAPARPAAGARRVPHVRPHGVQARLDPPARGAPGASGLRGATARRDHRRGDRSRRRRGAGGDVGRAGRARPARDHGLLARGRGDGAPLPGRRRRRPRALHRRHVPPGRRRLPLLRRSPRRAGEAPRLPDIPARHRVRGPGAARRRRRGGRPLRRRRAGPLRRRRRSGLTAGAVLRALRERLEAYKIPDRIHVQPSLPTTPHGKADRQRLRELAARSRP